MSIKTINNILLRFCLKMESNLDNVIIKTIEFDDKCSYNVLLELNNELYSIRHYEPIIIEQNFNYGNGHYHQYDIFDKKNKHFKSMQKLNLNN